MLNTSSGGWAHSLRTQLQQQVTGAGGMLVPLALLAERPPTARCGEREPTPSSGVGSMPRSGKWEHRGREGRGRDRVSLDLNNTNSVLAISGLLGEWSAPCLCC